MRVLLEQLRDLTPARSVYAVAGVLDLPEGTVRNWYLGVSFPDDYAVARIAEALDQPIEGVLATVNLAREKDPAKKAYWEGLARKFAACVAIGSAIAISPTDARSATGPANNSTSAPTLNFVQIMRQLLRRVRELLAVDATIPI